MRTTAKKARDIVAALRPEDKIRLVSGHDFWTTEAIPEAGIRAMTLTDGPHGLRKQRDAGNVADVTDSVPATCFPTAAALASTWDPALLEEIGAALGSECRAEDVPVLLGPALNLKRHPAAGRNFEYLSEDPVVAGRMAAGLVRGIQSQGVAACLKHFAANNQESWRMSIDAIVDERTLRELYLTGFEIAVRESDPWTVMCAYNQINGTHCGENHGLLTEILRDEWGFDGLAMTDWLATFDRVAAIRAVLDLEMPGSAATWDLEIAAALDAGTLAEADLDLACARIVDLMLRTAPASATGGTDAPGAAFAAPDFAAHHALARRAAAAGTVLLTNDGLLPLGAATTIAVVGAFAERPRYQGAGSSLVTPTRLDTFLGALREQAGESRVTYAPGYDPITGETTDALLAEAARVAAGADAVVVLAGLPSRMESEGFDRDHLRLPEGHVRLIDAVIDANPRTAVALQNGAPVEMPWVARPAAILEAYLGGQAGGGALADVVLGAVEPGGRLAESFPVRASDLPSSANFPGTATQVQYREGLYVGYRFHDASGVAPLFPFGHGLGYTDFAYSGLTVTEVGARWDVTVTVKNVGTRAGSDVVQVYVQDVVSTAYRPVKELKAFAKVHLAPGATQNVTVSLDRRAFAVWDVASHGWRVEAGDFDILVGASSTDIRAVRRIAVASPDAVAASSGPTAPTYLVGDAEFARMLGHPIPAAAPLLPFHRDSTV
ncbi:MAG TPA: glycoside hydrolase family 3 C-terminal domain-containing protein, partial [Demequinaceae bacterium]